MPRKSKVKPLRVISLFAGAGGLEIALCRTLPVAAIVSTDSNATFLKTTETNMPTHFPKARHVGIAADVRSLTGKQLLKALGGPCDLVMGGPPCDDFTKYGRRLGLSGDKGPLIFEFSRLVDEIQPRAFVFENVPNILKVAKVGFETMLSQLHASGYYAEWRQLRAADYGAPTIRERVILIGLRNNTIAKRFSFPKATHADSENLELRLEEQLASPKVRVCDVLADLPSPYTPGSTKFFNHETRKHSAQTVEKLAAVPQGQWVRGSYRYRAPWEGLCWSLTAGEDNATKSHIHPFDHREMSVREYARIHGFPDTWVFSGNHHNGIKQVANAIPVPLGEAIMRSFQRII